MYLGLAGLGSIFFRNWLMKTRSELYPIITEKTNLPRGCGSQGLSVVHRVIIKINGALPCGMSDEQRRGRLSPEDLG